ncbi:MAG TPA: hypothetical protein DCY35_10950 [Prolixibacteraceae bacterium]|nr:hypothetical protein [Prolixibacteraceae bacterium]
MTGSCWENALSLRVGIIQLEILCFTVKEKDIAVWEEDDILLQDTFLEQDVILHLPNRMLSPSIILRNRLFHFGKTH